MPIIVKRETFIHSFRIITMETQYKGYTITVEQDLDPISPREDSNLGTMVCWHNKYRLGDSMPTLKPKSYMSKIWNNALVLPLYLLDHSGIAIQTVPFKGFIAQWDSGRVGYIFCTYETIRLNYHVQFVTKKLIAEVMKILESEVVIYNQYLMGNVYHVKIEKNGVFIDGCGGIYDSDEAKEFGEKIVEEIIHSHEQSTRK